MLTEYFAFPQKFLFFDLAGLSPRVLAAAGNTLEVFFYLDRSTQDLEQNVSADTFQLGCTPVANLYRQLAEPIALSHTETEYQVVPDARRPLAAEVYGIERVTATSPANETVEYQPFYSIKHTRSEAQRQAFWYATRRPAEQGDRGTEVFLSLVDLGFTPFAPADWTLSVETTCLNRDLPHRLPFGGGQPHLRLAAGGPLARVECLTRPTPTLRPSLRRGALWRLISHLSLNHLSLADHEEGADALRRDSQALRFRRFRPDPLDHRRRAEHPQPAGGGTHRQSGQQFLPRRRAGRPRRRRTLRRQRRVPVCHGLGAVFRSLRFDQFLFPAGRHHEPT